jgi:hypothetical protein
VTADRAPANQDAQRLATFVWTLFDDLDAVISVRELLFLVEPQRDPLTLVIVRQLGEAWIEVEATRLPVINAVLSASIEALSEHGLTDAQLGLKLRMWKRARDEAVEEFSNSKYPQLELPERPTPTQESPPPGVIQEEPRFPRKAPRFLKRALKLLSRGLSYADSILESLTRVVVVGEALREMKQATEKLAGDTADVLPDEASAPPPEKT